jgi:hypothetical protein
MMCAGYQRRRSEAVDSLLVSMVAEAMLICASVLAFFVQFDIPVFFATGGAIAVLFIGSILCWKSQPAAIAVLALSLLAVQVMLILRFPILMMPFALVDVILVMAVAGFWHTGEQNR